MHRTFTLSRTLAVSAILFLALAGVKCKDDCEDILCEPCPSSRLVVRYVDNLGNCLPSFHQSAMVYAVNASTGDPLYNYSLADSCTATYLVQENVIYYLVSTNPAFADTIEVLDYEFQPGIEVSECCMCYPMEHSNILVNGDSVHVEFPDSAYTNDPLIRVIN